MAVRAHGWRAAKTNVVAAGIWDSSHEASCLQHCAGIQQFERVSPIAGIGIMFLRIAQRFVSVEIQIGSVCCETNQTCGPIAGQSSHLVW
jgi:hypothetical protein